MIRDRIKWWLFPGLNLHARLRWKVLPAYFGVPNGRPRRVLDAGCGNGMLAYRAWERGNHVVGLTIKPGEVERNTRLFNGMLGIDSAELSFRLGNLYELSELAGSFDEIICAEVLEHIRDDRRVCESFFRLLKTSGTLHLCCPNAAHPDNARAQLDASEAGGHVRAGYTAESYRELLEPIGFRILEVRGIGGVVRQRLNRLITQAQVRGGLAAGIVVFLATSPLHGLEPERPQTPYSLYVRARKIETSSSSLP